MNINEVIGYEAPLVEIVEVEVEKGFAVSGSEADSDGQNYGVGTGGF